MLDNANDMSLLGLGRGSRSACAQTVANDYFLFREREERAFGIGNGNLVLTSGVLDEGRLSFFFFFFC